MIPGIQEIQKLALKYSKPQLASMAQSGLIDTQKAVLAAMMRDRISKEDAKPPTSTVVQDALGLQQPQMAQQPQQPQQPMMAQQALQARPQMGAIEAPAPETPTQMAATGGLTSIPIKSEEYADGGIVAFAKGGTPYKIYEYSPEFMSVAQESTFDLEKQRQLEKERAFGIDPEFYKKRSADVALEREKLGKEKGNVLADALIAGGLGVAAGNSPYALQNIATGATKGFETYQGQMKDIRERDKAFVEADNRIKEAEYLRSIGMGDAADKAIQESKKLKREGDNANIAIKNAVSENLAKAKTEASKTQFTEGAASGRTAMQIKAQKEIAMLPGSEQKLLEDVYQQELAKNPEITKLEVYNKMRPTGQGTPYARAQMALQYDKEWNDMQENPVALRTFQKQNPTIKTSDDYVKHKMDKLEAYMAKTQGAPTPTQLTAEDQQALAWANANPTDPRAAQIKTRLGR
jgi:hypothetical protein